LPWIDAMTTPSARWSSRRACRCRRVVDPEGRPVVDAGSNSVTELALRAPSHVSRNSDVRPRARTDDDGIAIEDAPDLWPAQLASAPVVEARELRAKPVTDDRLTARARRCSLFGSVQPR
jgi:hypothetical protein